MRSHLTILAAALVIASPAAAAPRTPTGRVSVAQVMEALQKSGSDTAARESLTAYLTGLAETSAALNDAAKARFGKPMFCGGSGSMNGAALAAVLRAAAPDQKAWAKTEATPIIVRSWLKQKGC